MSEDKRVGAGYVMSANIDEAFGRIVGLMNAMNLEMQAVHNFLGQAGYVNGTRFVLDKGLMEANGLGDLDAGKDNMVSANIEGKAVTGTVDDINQKLKEAYSQAAATIPSAAKLKNDPMGGPHCDDCTTSYGSATLAAIRGERQKKENIVTGDVEGFFKPSGKTTFSDTITFSRGFEGVDASIEAEPVQTHPDIIRAEKEQYAQHDLVTLLPTDAAGLAKVANQIGVAPHGTGMSIETLDNGARVITDFESRDGKPVVDSGAQEDIGGPRTAYGHAAEELRRHRTALEKEPTVNMDTFLASSASVTVKPIRGVRFMDVAMLKVLGQYMSHDVLPGSQADTKFGWAPKGKYKDDLLTADPEHLLSWPDGLYRNGLSGATQMLVRPNNSIVFVFDGLNSEHNFTSFALTTLAKTSDGKLFRIDDNDDRVTGILPYLITVLSNFFDTQVTDRLN